MIQKHILFILSAYFGLSLYFSFVIAPILFNVLDKDIAGKIVSKIFPSYFWIGLIIFIIVLIYFIINSFGLITNCIIITAIVLIILQIFYILPASQILKTTNYDGFLKLHFWSIICNVIVLFINGISIIYIIFKH